eukprot:CAMPEP_0202908252 /NCGR_PEP_ID=MMETSP1392-20130828/45419_1 /ASSEMBLY_ACC=CAM_ASM_000868 /TAXON_ID=225041 /ORGANISM="Chlamydomonas chlamydogama, Strain SAG 11-48b" /LENGTH=213 /DNA_ID=CAMNT_0049597501 /DNA_START=182 /DNA_END=820 /DNA_ORIENTATION=-
MEVNAPPDPFYVIRSEVISQYNEIQQKLSRFHMLTAANPERKSLAKDIESECNAIIMQLDMTQEAIDIAAHDPVRFNLTVDEVASRRKWLDTTRRQVDGIKQSIRTMTASTPTLPTMADKIAKSNNEFVMSEQQKQEMIVKNQDHHLVEIGKKVDVLKEMNKQIYEHLEEDQKLIDKLDTEVETTTSRLKATQKKMMDIIRQSKTTTQITIIV